MKAYSIALLTSLMTVAASCQAEEIPAPATALVQAARFDFAMFDAITYSRGRAVLNGQRYADFVNCLSTHSASQFVPLLAKRISDGLTASEIQTSLDFYETPLGKKFTEASLLDAHHEHQIEMEKPLPEFSKQEQAEVSAYLSSPAARKLSGAFGDRTLLEAVRLSIAQTCEAK